MPILFCNVSWMKKYGGRTNSDPPLGGGGFPVSQGYCGEELNFVACADGFSYGHFETIKGRNDRQVLIERLGATPRDQYVDNVDIVWTAPFEGHDPRCVVGWYRNARLYRHRQHFNGSFPSKQHEIDKIETFRVKANSENVVLLRPRDRTLFLGRGLGWSGQASWWYAGDSTNQDARTFVQTVEALMDGGTITPIRQPRVNGHAGRAGPAAQDPYRRYVKNYEAIIHPRHNDLQRRFVAYIKKKHPEARFPSPYRDDLRFILPDGLNVMAEVKPTEPASLRLAIRTAIGQLLDYKQHQRWNGRQLIIVETAVTNADDLALAHDNGFGLAWPHKRSGFRITWPVDDA